MKEPSSVSEMHHTDFDNSGGQEGMCDKPSHKQT